jgi:hypothetical protein
MGGTNLRRAKIGLLLNLGSRVSYFDAEARWTARRGAMLAAPRQSLPIALPTKNRSGDRQQDITRQAPINSR